MLIGQAVHPQFHAVLVFHAVLEHVELQRAHHADHHVLKAGVGDLEDLDRALLGNLLDALDELLALHRVLGRDGHKMLRLEGGYAGIAELFARHGDGVADREQARIKHADDVAGVGLVDDLALRRHHGLRLGKAHLLAALHVVILGVALKLARANAHEGQTVTMRLVHVGLDLEDKGGKLRREHVYLPAVRHARQRRRGHLQEMLQEGLHAEVGQRRAEKHRRERAVLHGGEVKLPPRAEQLNLVCKRVALLLPQQIDQCGVVQVDLGDCGLFGVAGVGKVQNAALFAIVHAAELLPAADGPVDGIGVDPQLPLDLLAQVQRIPRLAVHLVDEGENGNVAQGADLKELARLRLDALGAVDDHHGAVRRHQRAVGILGKVLVARGVEDVDAVAAVLELHDRRGDGDAALLFDLHPVGGGGPGALALDLARLGDGPAVEQEFFGQRGFTGVRVRDDRKGPAAGNLFF